MLHLNHATVFVFFKGERPIWWSLCQQQTLRIRTFSKQGVSPRGSLLPNTYFLRHRQWPGGNDGVFPQPLWRTPTRPGLAPSGRDPRTCIHLLSVPTLAF